MRLSLEAKSIGTVNCNKEQYFHIECTLQKNRVQLRLNINPPFLHFKITSFGAAGLNMSQFITKNWIGLGIALVIIDSFEMSNFSLDINHASTPSLHLGIICVKMWGIQCELRCTNGDKANNVLYKRGKQKNKSGPNECLPEGEFCRGNCCR